VNKNVEYIPILNAWLH